MRKLLRKLRLWMDFEFCLALLALALRFGAHTWAWYAGVGLALLCAPLWALARVQLGDSFTVRPEARALVTRGLYSKIRHSIYLFGGVTYFGALLALQVWPVLAAWLALLPLQVLRARRESRLLRERFGESYERYRMGTWL